jgi:hypothetical protein
MYFMKSRTLPVLVTGAIKYIGRFRFAFRFRRSAPLRCDLGRSIYQFARRHNVLAATFDVPRLLTFHLWAFVIPAHSYATSVARKTGRRLRHPHVINVLIGLLLSTPHNPIYYLLGGGVNPGIYIIRSSNRLECQTL